MYQHVTFFCDFVTGLVSLNHQHETLLEKNISFFSILFFKIEALMTSMALFNSTISLYNSRYSIIATFTFWGIRFKLYNSAKNAMTRLSEQWIRVNQRNLFLRLSKSLRQVNW